MINRKCLTSIDLLSYNKLLKKQMMSTTSGNIKRFRFAGRMDAPYDSDLCSRNNQEKWPDLLRQADNAVRSIGHNAIRIYNEADPGDSILIGDNPNTRVFTSRSKALICLMRYRRRWIEVREFNRTVVSQDGWNLEFSYRDLPPSLIL